MTIDSEGMVTELTLRNVKLLACWRLSKVIWRSFELAEKLNDPVIFTISLTFTVFKYGLLLMSMLSTVINSIPERVFNCVLLMPTFVACETP